MNKRETEVKVKVRRRPLCVCLSKPQTKTIYYRKSCDCYDWSVETVYKKRECVWAMEMRLHTGDWYSSSLFPYLIL